MVNKTISFASLPNELILDIIRLSLRELPEISRIKEVYQVVRPFIHVISDHNHDGPFHQNVKGLPLFLTDPSITTLTAKDFEENPTENTVPFCYNPPASSTIIYMDLHFPEVSLDYFKDKIPRDIPKYIGFSKCTECDESRSGNGKVLYGEGLNLQTLDCYLSDNFLSHIHFNNPHVAVHNSIFTKRILQSSELLHLNIQGNNFHYSFSSLNQTPNYRVILENPELLALTFPKLKSLKMVDFKEDQFSKYLLDRSSNLEALSLSNNLSTPSPLSGHCFFNLRSLNVKSNQRLSNLTLPSLQKLVIRMRIVQDYRSTQYHYLPHRSHSSNGKVTEPDKFHLQHINCPKLEVLVFQINDRFPNIVNFQIPETTKVIFKGKIKHNDNLSLSTIQFLRSVHHLEIIENIRLLDNIVHWMPEHVSSLALTDINITSNDEYLEVHDKEKVQRISLRACEDYFRDLKFTKLKTLTLSPLDLQTGQHNNADRKYVFPGPFDAPFLKELIIIVPKSGMSDVNIDLIQPLLDTIESLTLDLSHVLDRKSKTFEWLTKISHKRLKELVLRNCPSDEVPFIEIQGVFVIPIDYRDLKYRRTLTVSN